MSALGWGLKGAATALALPSFLLTFPSVQDYLFNRAPRAQVTIFNEVPVYEGSRRVKGLQVLYRNDDLTEPPQRIMAARVRLSNEGGASITHNMVTGADPLGIRVRGGRFIEVSRVTATTGHLLSLAKPTVTGGQAMTLPHRLILDPGDHVDIDVLVLASTAAGPTYSALGKVAGQRQIGLLDLRHEKSEQSIFKAVLAGSWKIQVARLLFYFFVGLGLVYLARFSAGRFRDGRIRDRGRIAHELRTAFDMDDMAEARRIEIALGVYQYAGEAKFAAFLERLGNLEPLISPYVAARVETIAGPVAAQQGSVSHFLKKTNTGLKGVNDLVRRFGLISDKRVDPKFLGIAERVHEKAGDLSKRSSRRFGWRRSGP
jgi:hypothetical protein